MTIVKIQKPTYRQSLLKRIDGKNTKLSLVARIIDLREWADNEEREGRKIPEAIQDILHKSLFNGNTSQA